MQPAQEFFEEIRSHWDMKLPFVAYNHHNGNEGNVKALLQNDSALHRVSDFSESGFVFAPFDISGDVLILPANSSKEIITRFGEVDDTLDNKNIINTAASSAEKEAHVNLVQKGIEAINRGDLKKVVLSRKEELQLNDPDVVDIFKRLLKKYPTAFVYIWFHPEVGLWLGATPETLLQVERNRFKTMALAGTQKFAGTMEVSWGEKEREEQQFVTKAILENLKEYVSNIKTNGPYTTRAGALLHLRTDIFGEIISKEGNSVTDAMHRVSINGIQPVSPADPLFKENPHSSRNLKEIIYSIHPTPAVCGLPKDRAKQFILDNENYDREFYTGYLGELNMKKTIKRSGNRRNTENLAYGSTLTHTYLFVNLRCMKIEENRALLFVGGGITKDSIPLKEWEETQNKAGTMQAVLLN